MSQLTRIKRRPAIALLLAALLGLVSGGLMPAAPTPRRLLNRPVPAFTGQTLSGRSVTASYFRGKVTLLTFMYLGCPPCMAEVPVLHRLQAELPDSAFQILAVAAHTEAQLRNFNGDNASAQAAVRRHFGVEPIRYELVPECERAQSGRPANTLGPECTTISAKFFVDGYPLTLLIDRQGVVRNVYEGFPVAQPHLAQHTAALRTDINKLLVRR